MRQYRRILAIVALLIVAAPAEIAARSLDQVKTRGTLSLCAHPSALPFSNRRSGRPGFQIELAQEIAKRLGVQLDPQWVQLGFQYNRVDCDIVMDAIVEEDALEERNLRASIPYFRSGVVLALARGTTNVTSFDDLPGDAKIGVLVSSLAQAWLGEHGKRMSTFGYEDELLDAVAKGEIAAAAVSPMSIGWYNLNHPDAKLGVAYAYDRVPELGWNVAVGMRRSDAALRSEIDRAVTEMLKDGTFERIYASYGIEFRPPGD